ncbi:MAG: hypothetical protein IKI00_09365 [Bacteroidales bacterium]|nr:hypothetical protein [Bacteroidales bacterium]
MKKLLFLLLPFAFILAGCKYDDSKIWEELNAQKAQIASLESLNSNVSSLQSIVSALQKNITVTAIKATDQGHSVSFSDGTTVTILSAEAATPKLGAKQDVDGNYYWTIGGNWLLDDSGKKVSTGRTPKIKIEDNLWFISYDDGSSWSKVDGQASSICVFESVATDADNAIFTLSDGSVITLPLANAANKLQLVFNEGVFEKMRNGEVLSTSYKILAPEGAKTELETYESDGWTVTIYPADEKSGRISIKAPATVSPTKVMFVLTDDNGGSFVKIIKIGLNEDPKPEVKTEYIVDPEGGELVIPVSSCTADLSEDAEGWAEVVETGDQVILNIQSNESYDHRQCQITLEDGTVISLTQVTRDALVLSSDNVQIDGRRQKVAFVVSTNIRVTATVTEGSDWLSVTPTTKGLTDKVFTFIATRNTTEAERTAKVVFSGNDLTETCTVVQAVYDGPSTIDVTEAAATEEGDDVALAPSMVMALTTDGYVVSDGQSALLVFDSSNSPALGDSVSFSSVAGTFNDITTLEGVDDFTTTATGGRVVYPKASDITGSIDSYDVGTATYVSVTGDLVIENGSYNLSVAGAATKVVFYNPSSVVGLGALDGHNVTVDGYYYGKSGDTVYIVATKKQDNGSSSMTISQVIGLQDDTQFEVKEATVVAKATVGIIVSDGTSAVYLYHGSRIDVSASVGDVVSISGTKTTYNGVPELTITASSDVTVQSSGNPVNHPAADDINATLDSYSASTAEYITFTGDLVKSGNYYNVTVPGASSRQGSITSPINTSGYYISGKKIEELSGHNVTVKGYFNGLTSQGKYVTIILTDIVDNGSSQGGGDTPGGDTPGGGGSDVSGNTETVDFSAQGYENAQAVSSFSGQNFTISFDKGTNSNAPKYYNTGNAIRCYGSNSFTISSSKTITGITLTFASGEGTNEITVDKGSYSDGTWTGSASSVTFTVGGTTGHRRIAKVAVTIEE